MSENTIKIGLATDHILLRNTLKFWLSQNKEFKVTVIASSGRELLDLLDENSDIDVLLLDLFMPDSKGKEALDTIHKKHLSVKILILSMYFDDQLASDLIDMGVYGYLSRDADLSELEEAIKSASKYHIHQNQLLTKVLYWRTNNLLGSTSVKAQVLFTEQEIKVLQLLWEEKSTREIANEVFLSVSAVDKIKRTLKEKVDAKTSVGLLKYAIEERIIIPNTHLFHDNQLNHRLCLH